MKQVIQSKHYFNSFIINKSKMFYCFSNLNGDNRLNLSVNSTVNGNNK